MKISTPAFEHEGEIASRYTCDGEDVSPKLQIFDVPMGCKSIALIMEDPDAPAGVFDHWIAWNIPPKTTEIGENEKLSHEGINHFGNRGYGGPCPPKGPKHRYYFIFFALDVILHLPEESGKKELLKEMEGHILERAELMGTYKRD